MAKQDKIKAALDEIVSGPQEADRIESDYGDLDKGNIQPTGVGLREGELEALTAIGDDLGDYLESEPVARNALMRIAIRKFIIDYREDNISIDDLAGYFKTPEKPKPKLDF